MANEILNRRLETVNTKELKLVEKPIPATPPQGLIVKIQYAGVCHSDLHFWENKVVLSDQIVQTVEEATKQKFPLVFGHEISGEVYDIGTESSDGAPEIKVGDKVLVFPWISGCAHTCEACLNNRQSNCTSNEPMNEFIGLQHDGGWQTYVAVPKRSLVIKVPDDINLDVASLLPCSGVTAFNAVAKARAHIESQSKTIGFKSVLISGVGGVGLWAVSIARAILPPSVQIYAADIVESKLETAKQSGADETILIDTKASDIEVITSVLMKTRGGATAVLDFVGLGSAASRLVHCLSKGGLLVLVGLAGGTLPLMPGAIVTKRLTVTGSLVGDKSQVLELLDLLKQNKVRPPPIEHCDFSVEALDSVLRKMEDKKLEGRAIIKMP